MIDSRPKESLETRLVAAGMAVLEGRPRAAVESLRQLIVEAPTMHEAWYWLAAGLGAMGERALMDEALDAARTLHAMAVMESEGMDVARCRVDGAYALQVGLRSYNAKLPATASIALSMAAGAGHATVESLLHLGLSLQHQGRCEEAITVFRAVLEDAPTAEVHQFLLSPHFMVENGVERHAAEARRWGELHAPPIPAPAFTNDRDPDRRLRIGYVNPSFTRSQSRQFMTPVFEHHDHDAFEVFLYPSDIEGEDAWADAFTVRPIGNLDDAAAAALIRADKIDVLIDGWGHAAGGRLRVFALRPAPVQATWINYQQTTGLEMMDYSIHCDDVTSPDMDAQFIETVWRVGPTPSPFRPDFQPSGVPTPMVRNGYVTFGSFIHPAKLTDRTVALWSRILTLNPQARLVLKYSYFRDPVLQAATRARFAAHGPGATRLEFREHTSGDAYHAEFDDIDLALDPTPAPGGTTSLEALAHGVPVLTLTGGDFYSRIGVPIVAGCGFPDLVAEDEDDYVAKAVALSLDAARLQSLRDRVIPGFAASPFRDESGVTLRLESSFRQMFKRWVDAQSR